MIQSGPGQIMTSGIGRRRFISALGGTAFAWPRALGAQQPALPVVAFIHAGSPTDSASRADAFRKGLSETGYMEGQNVTVEYHWLEGHYYRAAAAGAKRRGTHLIGWGTKTNPCRRWCRLWCVAKSPTAQLLPVRSPRLRPK